MIEQPFTLHNDPPGDKPMAQGILFVECASPVSRQPKGDARQQSLLGDDNEPEPCCPSTPINPQAQCRKRCRNCVALVESLDGNGYCAACAAEIADNQPCPSCCSFGCRGCNQGPRKSPEIKRG